MIEVESPQVSMASIGATASRKQETTAGGRLVAPVAIDTGRPDELPINSLAICPSSIYNQCHRSGSLDATRLNSTALLSIDALVERASDYRGAGKTKFSSLAKKASARALVILAFPPNKIRFAA